MQKLTDIIAINAKETVTIVGSGGKTTLLWRFAEFYRQGRTLVTTTTKIFHPHNRQYDDYRDSRTLLDQPVNNGATLAGEPLSTEEGLKLSGLDPQVLEQGKGLFDRVLIEGDGARQLPLKGWADSEPVVPYYTDCTIGVVTLWPLGKQVDASIVFRLPLFCVISGAVEGDALTVGHVAAAITHPNGLWKGSRGRRVLFINQTEDEKGREQARQLCERLSPDVLQNLSMVVAGSARDNQGEVLWRKT